MSHHHDNDDDDAMDVLDSQAQDQAQPDKVQALHALTSGPLASSVAKLSSASRGIPSGKDFHFFNNFDEFKIPIQEISNKSQSILDSIGSSSAGIWGKAIPFPFPAASNDIDIDIEADDAYDFLVNVNDEAFERFDVSADEFRSLRKKAEEAGSDSENGFQLVYGKKKKPHPLPTTTKTFHSASHDSLSEQASQVKVATKDKKTKPRVPFHIPTIKRSQDEFNILVNNANQRFEHVWLETSEDGQSFIHPLEKLSVLDFVDKDIGDIEPVEPPSLESTPFKIVEEVKDLKELAAKLRGVNEFAVDLEHNQYRSFQGLTCLMQISTRTEDFVVDTLKLRIHVGPYLREVFKDPTKRKVMHGADRDIEWLQRDFGIYVCNMFDTGQASRVLKLERNSLEFLLHHFCGVTANKEYQNADWRLRPLPEEMLRYAREDTHYLMHIYDLMRIKLFSMPKESENFDAPLVEVYKRSSDVCMRLYEKELLTENSYLYIYGLQGAGLNSQQLAIVAGLCEWRDTVARAEDESTGYILPNKTLLEIAKQMPVTTSKLRRLLKSKHPYIERNLGSIVSIIRHSMQNAAAFEAAAEYLKEGRMEMASEENVVVADGSEAFLPDTPDLKAASARRESIDGCNTINGNMSSLLPTFPQLKESLGCGFSASGLGKDGRGGSLDHPVKNGKVNIQSDGYISELPRGSLTTSGLSREANADVSLSGKVPGAIVQMLKKPNRGFGALLGNSASKRKFDTDKKEEKLEKIRSSVTFPFHSFMGTSEQSKPVIEAPNTAVEIRRPEGPFNTATTSSKLDEIIMLEDNLNAEDSINGNTEATNEREKNNFGVSAWEMDNKDEPMSLSELSSSFEKCFESTNQNIKVRQVEKSPESRGFLELKPFDYEAARNQVRFGERPAKESGPGGEEGLKRRLDSGGKKKGSVVGLVERDDGTREFQQGRRRQAFPATGNRSATFR